METYNDGDTLKVVESFHREHGGVKGLAIDYLLYGTLAEIFGRDAGFNRGMGGSMHAFFPPFGVCPTTPSWAARRTSPPARRSSSASTGAQASSSPTSATRPHGCGPVWEAMMFAAMDQYRKLWPEEFGRRAADDVQLHEQLLRHGRPALRRDDGLRGAGPRRAGRQPGSDARERVDGYNPLAVADAIARKKQILLEGRGPVLLDTITYRFSGHSPSDASAYRTKEEVDLWRQHDSLIGYREYLVANGHASDADLDAIVAGVIERLVQGAGRRGQRRTGAARRARFGVRGRDHVHQPQARPLCRG
jgi:2-oxoisovalerate dehydrogenase E1 component